MEWQAVWDKEAEAYYYWNPSTQETTWDKPEGMEVPTGEPVAGATATDGTAQDPNEYYKSKEYYDWYMENMTLQAQQIATDTFASYKKKDQFNDLIANPTYDPTMQSDKHTRAFTQMNHYFDVEQYQLQRQMDRVGIKKKLTKKDLQNFRKKKLKLKREAMMSSSDK